MKKTLRQWRREHDYSQAYMAKQIGVTIKTYQSYERCPAEVKLITLFHICEVLKIKIGDIILFTSDKHPYVDIPIKNNGETETEETETE